MRQVLLVEDDAAVRTALSQSLMLAGVDPVPAGSFIVAKDHISADFEGIIVSDIRMPGRDGFHLLHHVQEVDADLPVILLTGEGDIPMAVRAMAEGAFGFLEKPCAPADLMAEIERALKTRALVLENRALRAQLETGDPAARLIFGISAQAEGLRAQVRTIAQSGSDAVVCGALGTGISKVAEVIHLCSPKARAPFEKRAASGLGREVLGAALAAAKGGTLFIDEITDMPAQDQLYLLDALEQEQRVEQGQGVRVIAGSSADLDAALEARKINADLFYRLSVSRVRIPPLSERPEDIAVLFRQYVQQASEQAGLTPPQITQEVIARLMAQDWPGNARALMSAAMRFAMRIGDPVTGGEGDGAAGADLGLAEQMAQVERSLLIGALRHTGGQASRAAQHLQVPRKTFYDKLARYGLKPEDYRE